MTASKRRTSTTKKITSSRARSGPEIDLTPIGDALMDEFIEKYGHRPGQGELTPEDIRSVKRTIAASKRATRKAIAAKSGGGSPERPTRGLGQVRVV